MLKKLILSLSFLLSFNAYAEDMSIYEADVEIDVTAENAAQAREKALSEANRKALYAITNRISAPQSTAILDDLNDNQILNFIYDVSVISEKVIETRYIASLKITINAPILKSYLAEKNLLVTIIPHTLVTIIPVYRQTETSAPLLWEDDNLWYKSWLENINENGQANIKPIAKDSQYQDILQAEDAEQLNGLSLDSIKNKTKSDDIYVAEIIQRNNELYLTLKSLTEGTVFSKIYEYQTNITFEKPIQDIKSFVTEKIKQRNSAQTGQQNTLTFIYNFNALKEWIELKEKLKNIPSIKETAIDTMTNRQVQVTINFTDSFENLILTFSSQGFSLTNSGNFYTLERQ